MRFFISAIALAIVLTATVAVATNSVEARERGKTTKDQIIELRQRLHFYQNTTKQQSTTPAKVTTTTKTTETVATPKTSAPTTETTNESDAYLETVRAEIHRLTNVERNRAGLPSLAHDSKLANVAKGHSNDMLSRNYFSHTSPEGCNMACRLAKANYDYQAWGENIAWRKSSTQPDAQVLAKHFVDSWMNSPSHRKNILSSNFTHEGIGLAREGNLVYATASFADPR